MPFLLAFALFACTGKPAEGGPSETAEEQHPLAPEQYRDVWDVDSLGCDDATVYWAFTGAIDGSGAIAGEETFYWFFSDEGWDDDCSDTFDLAGIEETTPVDNDACNSCDRDFTASYVLNEEKRDCPLGGYEQLFDDDDTDRIDEEAYTIALMLDTNPLGGEPGDISMWAYFQDDRSDDAWISRANSAGVMTPDAADDFTGGGSLEWSLIDGFCVTITEG